ncbi:hypothetical protein BCR44DRAFT_152518 [Catenaria anguillulae PL171]|uniref:Uncharacterized protein n=1 Tax=Catenaria anguillulae PL171 TaxID=765915 RepID=A0A1Y2HPF7_9FUNG|nr:hypothetical protein BCR44DRAFT_152518 [Catenaria anguillulae PL171]
MQSTLTPESLTESVANPTVGAAAAVLATSSDATVSATGAKGFGAIKSLCVFCGSSPGDRPEYIAAAEEIGRTLAQHNVRLVYGGGNGGLMGAVARSCHAAGGKVLGIIPTALAAFAGELIGETIMVEDMHVRKQLMNQYSDAFLTLPGGIGTVEELMETATWAQLHIHSKPVIVLNQFEFYTPLRTWIENAVNSKFLSEQNSTIVTFCPSVAETLSTLAQIGQAMDRGEFLKSEWEKNGRPFVFKWDGPAGMLQRGDDLKHLVEIDGIVRPALGSETTNAAKKQQDSALNLSKV